MYTQKLKIRKAGFGLIIMLLLSFCSFAQKFNFSNEGQRIIEGDAQIDILHQERFNVHFQSTYIYQYKPEITSPYQGRNSLQKNEENQNSLTSTLYLGARLWKGGEVYVNPELAGGSGLSSALGMAGSSNGETFRVGTTAPTLYLARGYLQQTFPIRKEWARKNSRVNFKQVFSDANQLAGSGYNDYIRLYAGKLSVADVFDNNEYANSARSQFMNWALMNNGAWDFAANTRGYTYAFITEMQVGKMNYKAGISSVPTTANGPTLNTDPAKGFAVNAEIARTISIKGRQGNIRLLGFMNTSMAARYRMAIIRAQVGAVDTPDISTANTVNTTFNKIGLSLNFDQQLNNTFGIFGRVGWNDGQTETWCFTEIDQSISLGISANGDSWNSKGDNCGLAFVANAISAVHQEYLAIGGHGFMLGDGKLNYAPELIAELYYSFKPVKNKHIYLTGDYQFCMNPGYNADRGPVHIFSARAHVRL